MSRFNENDTGCQQKINLWIGFISDRAGADICGTKSDVEAENV